MPNLRNKAPGPRGAWQGATLVMAEPGEVIEADDFEPEWFEVVGGEADAEAKPETEGELVPAPQPEPPLHPLDRDGDGKPGGSLPGNKTVRRRGRAAKD